MKKIAIVGAGVIGASWAAFYLAKGLDVVVFDVSEVAEAMVRNYIHDAWPLLTKMGLKENASVNRLTFTNKLEDAVATADFVQENCPERADFKADLFQRLDQIAPRHAILASSSSGLTMDVIQARCEHPERCVIGHPFNPPHIIPLVEIVGGANTSLETIERTLAFYTAVGKKPILLRKSMPGHVANRLQAALYKEVLYLVQEGVLSVRDADIAICYGPGLRWGVMGPSLQWHIGGGNNGIHHYMEHLMTPMEDLMAHLGTPHVTEKLRLKIIAGVLEQAGNRSVQELAMKENEVLSDLLSCREKVGI